MFVQTTKRSSEDAMVSHQGQRKRQKPSSQSEPLGSPIVLTLDCTADGAPATAARSTTSTRYASITARVCFWKAGASPSPWASNLCGNPRDKSVPWDAADEDARPSVLEELNRYDDDSIANYLRPHLRNRASRLTLSCFRERARKRVSEWDEDNAAKHCKRCRQEDKACIVSVGEYHFVMAT